MSSASAAKIKVRMDLRNEYDVPFFHLGFYLMRFLRELTGAFNSGTLDVPAHIWCRNRIGRRSRVKLYIIAGAAAFFFLMAYTPPIYYNEARVDGALALLELIGAVAGVAFAELIVRHDPVFIMETVDGIEYRIADKDIAGEFAVLNGVEPPDGYGETLQRPTGNGPERTYTGDIGHAGEEQGGDATRPRVRRTDFGRRAYKKDPREFRD